MRVLVAYASKHGATREIAEYIAGELAGLGLSVDLHEVGDVKHAGVYDAFVLGSAIYMGHWMQPMYDFIETNAWVLADEPTWLFSSGPVGDASTIRVEDPVETTEMLEVTLARDYQSFSGRLDPAELGLTERLAIRMVHAPVGDYREWDAIRDWAHEIGAALLDPAAESAAG